MEHLAGGARRDIDPTQGRHLALERAGEHTRVIRGPAQDLDRSRFAVALDQLFRLRAGCRGDDEEGAREFVGEFAGVGGEFRAPGIGCPIRLHGDPGPAVCEVGN